MPPKTKTRKTMYSILNSSHLLFTVWKWSTVQRDKKRRAWGRKKLNFPPLTAETVSLFDEIDNDSNFNLNKIPFYIPCVLKNICSYSLKLQILTDMSETSFWLNTKSPTRLHSPQYAQFMVCLSLDACQLNWCVSYFSTFWRLYSFWLLLRNSLIN